MLDITCSMEFDILEWKCHKRHSLLKQTRKRHKILILCNALMGHNNNIYDFCGEISKILPNTLSKVDHFCGENGEISPIYEHIACKIHRFDNFRWGIVGKQACPLWGPGNWNLWCTTRHVFLQNPTIVTKCKYFEAKYTKTPIFTWIIVNFRQNPYINVTTWICPTFLDLEMPWF